MGDEKGEKKEKTSPSASGGNDSKKNEKKKKGFISRIWNAIFRSNRDDFEKRLEYITKEENMAVTRLSNRSRSWRRTSRQLILFSVLFEVTTSILSFLFYFFVLLLKMSCFAFHSSLAAADGCKVLNCGRSRGVSENLDIVKICGRNCRGDVVS